MPSNLDRLRAIDSAWNDRDWDRYAALLAPGLRARMQGDEAPHGRTEHVTRAREFCTRIPDNHVVTDPYVAAFEDADRTCVVAVMTGRTPGTGEPFEVQFATVCRWQHGVIAEQQEFTNHTARASAKSRKDQP